MVKALKILTLTPVFLTSLSFAQAPSAEDLLKASDRARGGLASGITWKVELETTEDKRKQTRSYLVKAKGNDAHVETLSPARNKGEIMLFNDRTIWFFKPGMKKPISLSARQRLSGQAANGDIASTNYARDYEGKIIGEEKVNGVDAYRLELKAKAPNVTYDRINYWISKDKQLGVQAEFLTLEGEPFKRADFEYKHKVEIDGKEYDFISSMKITDAAFPENITVVNYDNAKPETHPDRMFNINNLIR